MTSHTGDPRMPVVVGMGVANQRFEDPRLAAEPVALMAAALRRAATDTGAASPAAILSAAELIAVPKGMWGYTDPARLLATEFDAPNAQTALFELGVLQPSLFRRACSAIANGEIEVAIVVGGEAKYRVLRSAIMGITAPETVQNGATPDERIVASADVLHPIEIARGLPVPARQYAMIDAALRSAQGLSVEQHVVALADLWSSFSQIAVHNPDAWNRDGVSVDVLRGTQTNPMHALPYTKLHCSQWNVDQAAAFIVCSAAAAQRFGCAPDQFVFPHAIVESNFMAPLVERRDLHRSPAVAAVGAELARAIGIPLDAVGHLDLYSCFPAAVRMQIQEFGITLAAHEALTVTGGMTFGGGPLNNYTLQALARLCAKLRADRGAIGIGTAVSGMLTKFGACAWSCRQPSDGFVVGDVSATVAATTPLMTVDSEYVGPARIASYTVAYEKGTPFQAIAIADTQTNTRTICTSGDSRVISAFEHGEWIGREITIDGANLSLAP